MSPKPEIKKRLSGHLKQLLATQAAALFLCLLAGRSPAQTYTILHTFGTNTMGLNPYSTLVQGPDGALYGTTSSGGVANLGQVFKVNPDGSGYTALKDFTGTDGAYPEEGLLLSGTTLYGTTGNGGTNENGTVFKLNTDGTGFAVLKRFTGDDGASPYPRLLLSNGVLYGTTYGGGTNGYGTVFKLNTNGTGFAVLKHFTGQTDGSQPSCSLVLSGTTLYGTTTGGGTNGDGTVFKINTDGSDYTVLKDFDASSDGGWPESGLVLSGTTLYGTASWGGAASGNGTVFKLNNDGSGFAVLKDFTNSSDGTGPNAGLILSGGTLYGTTIEGGSSGYGTVFKLNNDGSAFAVLKDFTNWTDGANCWSGLLLSNTTLFGTASAGGNYGYGAVFSLETDGSDFTVITSFAGGDGTQPGGNLLLVVTNFYGTTRSGGASGNGTIFKVNLDGSGYAVLKEFTGDDGAYPNGSLTVSGTTLYGLTCYGGSNGCGTVFKIETDGSGFTSLYQFSALISNGSVNTNADGGFPQAGLVLSSTTLYGTAASGGMNGNGVVFEVNTDGSGYTLLHTFSATAWDGSEWTNADGALPSSSLTLSGTTLYGTTGGGSSNGWGTVFAMNTNGSGYTLLKQFAHDTDGGSPTTGLLLSGTTLYGALGSGGGPWNGAVFRIERDGTSYTVLKRFAFGDGVYPLGGLTLSGATLFGTMSAGGTVANGTVFQVNPDGGGFAVLKDFAGSDGNSPQGGLVMSGAALYGTATYGGGLNGGLLFSLSPGPPTISVPPQSQTIPVGATIDFEVQATGWPAALAYQWYFNGANALSGATNSTLELTNVLFAQSGAYTVVISNLYGSVTSAVATLLVEDPFINSQPSSQSAGVGDTVQFIVDALGTAPLSFQWLKDGTNLNDDARISGAQTAILTLSNVLAADAGGYSVIVTNVSGSVTSLVATLSVADPFIRTPPLSQTADPWQTVQFSVLAGGTQPLSYQWLKDGTNLNNGGRISGAQTATLAISNVFGGDAGQYSVLVSNTSGNVTSSPAVLTVNTAAYAVLHYFSGNDGAFPRARLLLSGTTLYGTTCYGGITNDINDYGCGTVFKVNTDGSGFTVLHSFNGSDGQYTFSDLVLSGSTLYGTTPYTVFKINTDGTGFTVLCSFGGELRTGLVLSGTTLFGTTFFGGSYNSGTVFKINTDGTGFTALKNFTGGSDGGDLESALVLSGTTLYGTTLQGGLTNQYYPYSCGTVFKINTDGSGFSTLYRFTGINAENPAGQLGLSGGTLYGITDSANSYHAPNYGVVYKVSTGGGAFTVLKDYPAGGPDGPLSGGLYSAGSTLYGTTWGTVFSINTDGSDFTVLKRFAGSDGNQPLGSLVFSGMTLYGTTSFGGIVNNYGRLSGNGNGVLFSLRLPPIPPALAMLTRSQTAESGGGVSFAARVDGFPPPDCQWFLNGKALEGCTNSYLELTNVQSGNLGSYTLVISNAFGAVTSTPVMLNVIPPVQRRPVPAISVMGDTGSALNIEYTDSLGSPSSWLALDMVRLTRPPQYYFDISTPLPPQRFYRAWQTGTPAMLPSLNLNSMTTAITLTGNIGDSLRVDYINRIGPTNAWVTLDTVTLTNTSQLYFDTSAWRQPQRLYRFVQVP
jgi:uncharacterized repeat protein (TIGR03803 family)